MASVLSSGYGKIAILLVREYKHEKTKVIGDRIHPRNIDLCRSTSTLRR